jgi:hypothetical protein
MRLGGANLLGCCKTCDAAAQMAEVLRRDRETQDLFDDRREIRQGTNDSERRSMSGARQTASYGQNQRVLDRIERHATLVQVGHEMVEWRV